VTRLRRAFVAVVPPREVLDAVEHVVAPVRPAAPPRLKWTHAGQWHLTLQYLGAVDDADELTDALRRGLHGRPPVALALGGAGAFPSISRASVVWIGLDQGEQELAMLADAVQGATEPLGYEPEHRDFTAHVTIARSQRARPLANLVHSLGDGPVGPVFDVNDVVLMESDRLLRDGAVYREVANFPLGEGT
jgi:2'-5' RNA ligase